MSQSRPEQLLETIEAGANALLPLIRQLRQQGPHGKDQARAINALENEINTVIGIHIGEVKVLFGMEPATVHNGQKQENRRPPAAISG